MGQFAYAAVLVGCLSLTLPLERVFGLGVLRQRARLARAIGPVALAFVGWDVLATGAGHWWFDPAQTLPPRLLGLPLEEVAFFIVVPLAGVLTYEAVGAVARLRRGAEPR